MRFLEGFLPYGEGVRLMGFVLVLSSNVIDVENIGGLQCKRCVLGRALCLFSNFPLLVVSMTIYVVLI